MPKHFSPNTFLVKNGESANTGGQITEVGELSHTS